MPAINKTICICGAGTMGIGIARVAAENGFAVTLYDLNNDFLQQQQQRLNDQLHTQVQKGKITPLAKENIIANIQCVKSVEQCQAGLIIEVIVEKLPAKIELFNKLAAVNGPSAIYATNTSSLAITSIAREFLYKEKLGGLHFFNPPTHMQLVEVVHTVFTSAATIQNLVDTVYQLKKTPVVCKDAPGFIVNRVARPFYIEALRLAEEGVPIADIDQLLEAAGFKLGPFRLMDLIGNDINYAVSCSIYAQLNEPARLKPSAIQEKKLAEGKLGRKTSEGFYKYST
jgi:3-hydroxybutyryl-CoA dehydrogenase